jgi:hypothetical protein
MADAKQLAILKLGVAAWNEWREKHPDSAADLGEAYLSGADLSGADLTGADLDAADLTYANLRGAHLFRAHLGAAHISQANLSGAHINQAYLCAADLFGADLSGADLSWANLSNADLDQANLSGENLDRANLSDAYLVLANLDQAQLARTVFGDTNLAGAKGLDSCVHVEPSTLDDRTLAKSGPLPLAFLRGVGLSDLLIDLAPALRGNPLQFYACFISYSSKDQAFAERLHADLQSKGVRCWFAPHDLPIGAKTRPMIDEAIREYDKLLLVLSKHSVTSAWVEHEIERALAKELRTRRVVLFPVRLDDAIKTADTTWAREIREERNIGDMRRWRNNHDAYQRTFERVLRDLRTDNAKPPPRTEA